MIEHIKLLLIDSTVYAEEVEPTGVVPMEVSLERYSLTKDVMQNYSQWLPFFISGWQVNIIMILGLGPLAFEDFLVDKVILLTQLISGILKVSTLFHWLFDQRCARPKQSLVNEVEMCLSRYSVIYKTAF